MTFHDVQSQKGVRTLQPSQEALKSSLPPRRLPSRRSDRAVRRVATESVSRGRGSEPLRPIMEAASSAWEVGS